MKLVKSASILLIILSFFAFSCKPKAPTKGQIELAKLEAEFEAMKERHFKDSSNRAFESKMFHIMMQEYRSHRSRGLSHAAAMRKIDSTTKALERADRDLAIADTSNPGWQKRVMHNIDSLALLDYGE